MNTAFFEYMHNKIGYRWQGAGKPVFLLHGFGEDSSVWNEFVPLLNQERLYILPDLPGYGLSNEKVNLDELPDMERLAGLFNGLSHELVKVGVMKPEDQDAGCWIGHSMGGYIALAMEAHHRDLVGSLFLFHSTAFADSEEKKELRRKSMHFIQNHGAAAFLEQAIPNLFTEKFVKSNNEKIDSMIRASAYLSQETLCHNYEVMIGRPPRLNLLENTSKPVGFIIGGQDKAVPVKDSLIQCQIPKKSYIQFLSGSAHMGMMENPLETSTFLERFLQDT